MLEHLLSRHYDPARYPTQWITDNQLVVPLFDFIGRLRGCLTYTRDAPKEHENPRLKRYLPRAPAGYQPLWGTELPVKTGVVFLTETIFKSASLHARGYDSWAVCSSARSDPHYQQLMTLPYQFVCLGDDDKAGRELARSLKYGATSRDLDELTVPERLAVIKQFDFLF